jgi:hypothetical protein
MDTAFTISIIYCKTNGLYRNFYLFASTTRGEKHEKKNADH